MQEQIDMDDYSTSLTPTETNHRLKPMPKTSQPERVLIPITRELVERIEEFRWSVRASSRAEAIRALIVQGLKDPEGAAKEVDKDVRKP